MNVSSLSGSGAHNRLIGSSNPSARTRMIICGRSRIPLELVVMQKFHIIIKNEILGDSSRDMTMEQIKNFNLVVFSLAKKAAGSPGQYFTSGMWTVRTA